MIFRNNFKNVTLKYFLNEIFASIRYIPEVKQNLFDIKRGQGRSSSTAAIPGRAHYNNYYANSTADIAYLNSPITGAVIWNPSEKFK